MLPLGILRNMLYRHAHMLHGHVVGIFLLAIVQLIGQHSNLLPAGVERHAAGELIFRRVHRIAGEVGGEIPAHEIKAIVFGQPVFQRGIAKLMGGIGKAPVFLVVAGEDGLGNTVFDVPRLPLRAAKVHSDIHTPVGIQRDIAGHLPGKVVGFPLAGGIIVPAREGQALNIGIGGLLNGAALHHIEALVSAKLFVVIQEVRLVGAYATEGDLNIIGRHGERNRASVRGVFQSRGLGSQAKALIAIFQLGREGDSGAGCDGSQLGSIVAHAAPGIDTGPCFHGEYL